VVVWGIGLSCVEVVGFSWQGQGRVFCRGDVSSRSSEAGSGCMVTERRDCGVRGFLERRLGASHGPCVPVLSPRAVFSKWTHQPWAPGLS